MRKLLIAAGVLFLSTVGISADPMIPGSGGAMSPTGNLVGGSAPPVVTNHTITYLALKVW
jgi:hypothetical protein